MRPAAEASPDRHPGSLRDFERSLPMALMKAREAAMTRFRPLLRRHGLTEQQWRVIRALAERDRIDVGELASRSFLLAPSLTRILRHLENKALVRRTADRSDQRRSFVELSAGGRRLFDAIAPESEALYADIEAAFGVDKLAALYELLGDFCRSVGSPARKP